MRKSKKAEAFDDSGSKPEAANAFHERLRSAISERGTNPTAVARRADISQGGVQRILAGGEPTRPILVALARALQVSVEWLATGEGPMRREGILSPGEARQLARATMSATETMRAAAREVDVEKQRLIAGPPPSPAPQIDLHILAEAERLVDETLLSRGQAATPQVRSTLVAEAYGLILSLIEDDIDEAKAIKAASNVVRLKLAV